MNKFRIEENWLIESLPYGIGVMAINIVIGWPL